MFSGSFLKHKIYKVQFCFDNFFDLKKLVVLIRYHKFPVTCSRTN